MVETSYKDIILPLLNEKVTIPSNHNHWPSFSRSSPNNTGLLYISHILLFDHCLRLFVMLSYFFKEWPQLSRNMNLFNASLVGSDTVSVFIEKKKSFWF